MVYYEEKRKDEMSSPVREILQTIYLNSHICEFVCCFAELPTPPPLAASVYAVHTDAVMR